MRIFREHSAETIAQGRMVYWNETDGRTRPHRGGGCTTRAGMGDAHENRLRKRFDLHRCGGAGLRNVRSATGRKRHA